MSSHKIDTPSLYGDDFFWQDTTAPEQADAVISGPNEFLIPDTWKVQVSEKFKLRLVDEEGTVLKATVKANPTVSGVRYFVGVRNPPHQHFRKRVPRLQTQ